VLHPIADTPPDGILCRRRDKWGRTPLVVGKKRRAYCVAFESCTFANLGYVFDYELRPRRDRPDHSKKVVQKVAPHLGPRLKICAYPLGLLWLTRLQLIPGEC
jgi:amidophosphoribosyltransferase